MTSNLERAWQFSCLHDQRHGQPAPAQADLACNFRCAVGTRVIGQNDIVNYLVRHSSNVHCSVCSALYAGMTTQIFRFASMGTLKAFLFAWKMHRPSGRPYLKGVATILLPLNYLGAPEWSLLRPAKIP